MIDIIFWTAGCRSLSLYLSIKRRYRKAGEPWRYFDFEINQVSSIRAAAAVIWKER